MFGFERSVKFCLFFILCAASTVSASAFVKKNEITCEVAEGEAAVLVHVMNVRTDEGNVRVQTYGSNPEDFLEKGKWLERIDTPLKQAGLFSVCVPVKDPGVYSVVVMHDRNANGKADFFSEGFGFSNNPKLALAPPDGEDVLMEVPAGVTEINVTLTYIFGSGDEKKEKRRKLRRR